MIMTLTTMIPKNRHSFNTRSTTVRTIMIMMFEYNNDDGSTLVINTENSIFFLLLSFLSLIYFYYCHIFHSFMHSLTHSWIQNNCVPSYCTGAGTGTVKQSKTSKQTSLHFYILNMLYISSLFSIALRCVSSCLFLAFFFIFFYFYFFEHRLHIHMHEFM